MIGWLKPPETGHEADMQPLSPRELDVVDLVRTGMTNRAVAEALYIGPETVKTHLKNIYSKVGVSSRWELSARVLADPTILGERATASAGAPAGS